jgi:ADP-ribosylglycohydrolase
MREWRRFFETAAVYVDGATRGTLKNIDAGKPPLEAGSRSTDLAGAARIAPLVYRYRKEPEELLRTAVAQTRLTHDTPEVAASAAFFAAAASAALAGASPVAAMRQAARDGLAPEPLAGWLEEGLRSASRNTREALLGFGQMCEADAAFRAVVHLIAKYEGRLEDALVENVMAGGDSAGRGLIAGMVLGAHAGAAAIPEGWLKGLNAGPEIGRALAALDSRAASGGDPAAPGSPGGPA